MKVTNIKQQAKNNKRYSIFIDHKYSFSLSEGELLNRSVRIGQSYTSSEIKELKLISTRDKAYTQVINLIARRPRSEWEIRDYLRRKGNEDQSIEQIVNKLTINKLINDKEFALRWVENRRLLKNTSKRKLKLELISKHVAENIVDSVLAEDDTEEIDVLKELVSKKRKQTRYQDDLKLMQYLSRQGFNYDDIKQVVSDDEP
ncbi:RecX family transcriptional regulator [Candidatus Saccharibacteria bacterium]|nr:RecX family transcriptional regulator [Candidatus Saccharibacteria bacterium]